MSRRQQTLSTGSFDPDFEDCSWTDAWQHIYLRQVEPGQYGSFYVDSVTKPDFVICGDPVSLEEPLNFRRLLGNDDTLWMTDSPQERLMMYNCAVESSGRTLVGGLGLGVYPQYAFPHTTDLTIIELIPDIIELVMPLVQEAASAQQYPGVVDCIQADIEAWLQRKPEILYDTIFLDTWQDRDAIRLPYVNTLRELATAHLAPNGKIILWSYAEMLTRLNQTALELYAMSSGERSRWIAKNTFARPHYHKLFGPINEYLRANPEVAENEFLAWVRKHGIHVTNYDVSARFTEQGWESENLRLQDLNVFDPEFDDFVLKDGWKDIPIRQIPAGIHGSFQIYARVLEETTFKHEPYTLDEPVEIRMLTMNNTVWMSDTPQERIMMYNDAVVSSGKVLVGGLGLGVYPQYALPYVSEITIIEYNREIIDLVSPIVLDAAAEYDVPVSIIQGDIEEFLKVKPGKLYDTIFLDTWEILGIGRMPYINYLRNLAVEHLAEDGKLLLWGYAWMKQAFMSFVDTLLLTEPDRRSEFVLTQTQLKDDLARELLWQVMEYADGNPTVTDEEVRLWAENYITSEVSDAIPENQKVPSALLP